MTADVVFWSLITIVATTTAALVALFLRELFE